MHAQQQLLNALQATLAAGATLAGTRVFVDRVDPLQPEELPAILIEEDGETAEPFRIDGLEQRELSVNVHCVIAHSTTAAPQARAFGLAVEKLLANQSAWRPDANVMVNRITSSRPVTNGEADRLLATRQQAWVFAYLVRPETPDTFV